MIDFKEYDKIISNHKYDMIFMMIYYNLICNDVFESLTDEQIEILIQFIYKTYLKDESHVDLAYICDKAFEFRQDILKNNVDVFNTWDLLKKCYQ